MDRVAEDGIVGADQGPESDSVASVVGDGVGLGRQGPADPVVGGLVVDLDAMEAVGDRGSAVGSHADEIADHDVVVAVHATDDDARPAVAADDVALTDATDGVAGRAGGNEDARVGIGLSSLGGVDAHPVVDDGVVVPDATGVVDLDALVVEAVNDEAADDDCCWPR